MGAALHKAQRLVGVAWFEEAEYPACRALMADAELLPVRYAEWLEVVRDEVAQILGEGNRPLKVTIEPKAFVAWCRERMIVRDHAARRRYAALAAFREMNLS